MNLLKYVSLGGEYIYTIREKTVPIGYTSEIQGTTLINHYENKETIAVTGEKQWEDADNKFQTRPENITVELLQNNQVIQETLVQEDATGNWLYQFTDLLKYDSLGEEYVYTVREKVVPTGYRSEVKGTTIINQYTTTDSDSGTTTTGNSKDQVGKPSHFPLAGDKKIQSFFPLV